MDPLSISASVAGLVTLAGTVFSLAAKYIKDVKEAPKVAKDLLDEVKQFSVLLHHLSLVARELEITTKTGEEALQDSPNLQWHHIHDCQTILNRVQNGLTRATESLKSSSTLTKIRSRLKWPFSSDDTKEMIQTIQRHKQTINVALSANSYSRLAICLSRQEAADKRQEENQRHLSGIQDTVNKILEIDTKVSLDEMRKEVLNSFTKFANPWHEFQMVQSLRHPLTGLWFTESDDFKEWRATPGSKMWITGIPGAGKSVLAGLILHECLKLSSKDSRKATTYFFCTYRNKDTHSARNLLSSLASQLARQHEEAFLILEKYHQEIVSRGPVVAEPSLRELLTVFKNMCRTFDQVFVVVDGLDECDTDDVVHNLSQMFLKDNSASITPLLLSRDVVLIRDRLESDFSHIEIEAHKEDIQLYVFTELEKRIESKQLRLRNPELKTEIADRLVHGAKGMFRWVACQLDYLGELPNDRERRNALSKLPPTLPATYERILAKVEKSSKEVRRLVQRTLLLIRALLDEVDYLREALAIRDDSNALTEEDMVDEYEIMLRCSSLIRKSTDGKRLEFSHFTVQEFLEGIDPTHATLHLYRVSVDSAEALLSQLCLRYLLLKDFEREPRADMDQIEYIRKRTETRPFYGFCATRWIRYIRDLIEETPDKNGTKLDATTMDLIRMLFESRKRASFCQWIVEYVKFWVDSCTHSRQSSGHDEAFIKFMAAVLRPDFTPLHMASVLGLPSLCDHLLSDGAKVNLKSLFGTPLHCALGGMTVFLNRESRVVSDWVPIAQSQTMRLLLAAGASATRFSTPFRQTTLMGAMRMSPVGFDTFALFPDLVQAGLTVEEEDLDSMESYLNQEGENFRRFNANRHDSIIVSLLKCLRNTKNQSGALVRRLNSIVYQYDLRQRLDLSDLIREKVHDELFNSSHGPDILQLMIVNNDINALEKMLDENRDEFFKNARFDINDEKWSAVHLACDSHSSNVLELLLKIGSDPEATTHLGTKPIHLSHADQDGGETLKVLLQYHVSTKARNGSLTNIWHLRIQNRDLRALKLLVSLASDKSEALQIVSGSGQTPICLALDKQDEDAVNVLLEHCPTTSFWKSNMPLYRQAARLGSLKVINKLLDMGIQPDEFDDELGSPLHDMNLRASVPCVKLLTGTFPHFYRQRNDGQTPFQSFLTRAVEKNTEVQPQVLEALLPAVEASQPEEVAKQKADAWLFFCSTVVKYAPRAKIQFSWFKQMLLHFIDAGFISCFEERYKMSASVPFATELDQVSSMLLPGWLDIRQGRLWNYNDQLPEDGRVPDGRLPLLWNWEYLSQMLIELACTTAFGNSAIKHDSITRLLSLAILHDDYDLVKWLLENGVDVHRRVDSLSALEIACVPAVAVSKDTFGCLLSHSKQDRLNEHNAHVRGYTIIHFTGIHSPFQKRSLWKLRQILKAGANANAVTSDFTHKPALVLHIIQRSVQTAEVLLQSGADPWLTDVDGFNAALAATIKNNVSLFRMIARHSAARKRATLWGQTWKDPDSRISGANAFHLAARHGSMDCMQIYLHEKWLEDLESVDDDLQTPMHYAARYGQCSVIRFLHNYGCDINRTARDGKLPLHLAIEREDLYAMEELLRLGAEIKADAHGLSPLAYAYRTGNLKIVNALQGQREDRNATSQLSRKGITKILDAFQAALKKGDLHACGRFVVQGFSIDSEMCNPWPVTPLMAALCMRLSSEVVEWLLKKGAKVSIVFEGPEMPEYATALEAATAYQKYNRLLPTLLRLYLEEGGDFHRLEKTPLHIAIYRKNYEGLKVLLDEMRQRSYNVEDIVNQKTRLGGEGALHMAAIVDSVDAATLLISNGANLELTDMYGFTPLHSAAESGSINVLKLLIKQGVCTEPLTLRKQRTPLMLACSEGRVEVAEYLLQLEQTITEDLFGMEIVGLALDVEDQSIKLQLCTMLFPRGFDLHRKDTRGYRPIFDVMACPRHWVLRHLLREYPLSLQVQDIQWSSRLVYGFYTSDHFRLANITRGYRLVHRYLGREEPLVVSKSVAVGERSLLYSAASRGLVAAVDDLLSIGIDIEGGIGDEGTALTVAVAHGQLDVVKYLARRGANIFHHDGSSVAVYGSKEVLQWLLVGRHIDQAKIMNANLSTDEEGRQIRKWAGFIQVGLSLKWEWRKRRSETMLEYAIRFQNILKAFQGEVVKPIVEDESMSAEMRMIKRRKRQKK